MDDELFRRCLHLVQQCSNDLGWALSSETERHYAAHVAGLLRQNLVDLAEQRQVLINFHYDHGLVEALRDQHHPEHGERWHNWSQQALRVLLSRYRNVADLDRSAHSLEDLAQEAMHDLWRALPDFHYRSRFQTWAFTVIANCFVRTYRYARTQKRRVVGASISLEGTGQSDSYYAATHLTPDEAAMASILLSLSQGILAQHPDTRLRAVFYLWAQEDQPLRVIGAHLNLSIPRVHALLNQALTILRNENSLRHWNRPSE